MRKIIVPGEQISEKPFLNEFSIVENEKTYASVIGFMDEQNRFVPTKNIYRPKQGDTIIGIVVYLRGNGYKIDINTPFEGFLSGKDTRVPFSIGEIVYGRIKDVDEIGNVDIIEARKLPPGKIIEFPAAKIPRLIGKKNSMITTIAQGTGTEIYIGNNGYVYLLGNNIPLALKTIDMVNKKSHISGLTQQVLDFLMQNKQCSKPAE
ncbi:MAG: KH domain-containing protein [Candidatus Micrarchaeota archaeon]